jgi:hypothetical protein
MGVHEDRTSAFHFLQNAYNSVKREVFYSILIEFGVPMKAVSLVKMCLRNV